MAAIFPRAFMTTMSDPYSARTWKKGERPEEALCCRVRLDAGMPRDGELDHPLAHDHVPVDTPEVVLLLVDVLTPRIAVHGEPSDARRARRPLDNGAETVQQRVFLRRGQGAIVLLDRHAESDLVEWQLDQRLFDEGGRVRVRIDLRLTGQFDAKAVVVASIFPPGRLRGLEYEAVRALSRRRRGSKHSERSSGDHEKGQARRSPVGQVVVAPRATPGAGSVMQRTAGLAILGHSSLLKSARRGGATPVTGDARSYFSSSRKICVARWCAASPGGLDRAAPMATTFFRSSIASL